MLFNIREVQPFPRFKILVQGNYRGCGAETQIEMVRPATVKELTELCAEMIGTFRSG
jgi:hypothetical protein